jgi:hypothetical protein
MGIVVAPAPARAYGGRYARRDHCGQRPHCVARGQVSAILVCRDHVGRVAQVRHERGHAVAQLRVPRYFGEQGEDGAAVPQHRLGRLVFWHGSFVVNMW